MLPLSSCVAATESETYIYVKTIPEQKDSRVSDKISARTIMIKYLNAIRFGYKCLTSKNNGFEERSTRTNSLAHNFLG